MEIALSSRGDMDTRRLRYFVAIVDRGTITRAAEALHLAQPALSQHVAALEADLGQKLLERSRRGVTPTAAGRSLYRYAQGILRLEDAARHEIGDESASPAGTVTIGLANYSPASALVVPVLQLVRQRYPRIVLRILETLTVVHSQAIKMGQIDAALIYDPGHLRGVRFERLSTDDLYLVASRRTPVPGATATQVAAEHLGGLDFMLPSRTHTIRALTEQLLRQKGLELRVVAELENARPLLHAVAVGVGVTVMPRPAAESMFPGDQFVLRRIVEPSVSVPFALATPEEQPLSAAADAVIELLREAITPRLGSQGVYTLPTTPSSRRTR
jgi:LysR family nitrogen assimilation transcriptional regulator